MKHVKWVVGLLALTIVPVLAWAGMAHAQQFRSSVDEGQTIHSSLYSSGKDIDIKGVIEGDVYCFGQTITISADVRGDVLCAGQDVTINGNVDGDVRVAGQNVSINAKVTRGATVAAMTFSLDADASIGRDLTATGDSLNIKGKVGRDVVSNGNTTIFNGVVGRNVKSDGQKIQLKSNARIKGNVTYTSPSKIVLENGAVVSGSTTQAQPKKSRNWTASFNVVAFLFSLVSLTLIVMVIAVFFPRFMTKTSDKIKASFGRSLAVGFVASLLLPALCGGLLFSLIGIPLAVFMLVAAVFGAMLSAPVVAFYVGRLVLKDNKNTLLIALVGGLITVTVTFIPVLGILAAFLVVWLGFGALLLSLREHTGQAHAKR